MKLSPKHVTVCLWNVHNNSLQDFIVRLNKGPLDQVEGNFMSSQLAWLRHGIPENVVCVLNMSLSHFKSSELEACHTCLSLACVDPIRQTAR